MEDPRVKELAQTLKKSKLAVSDYEAVEKAKAILGVDIQKEEEKKEAEDEIAEITEDFSEKNEETKEKKEGFFSHLKEKLHHEKMSGPEMHKFSQPDYDISKEELSINDLMREVGVEPEMIPEEKGKIDDTREKISELKKEILKLEEKPEEGKLEDIKRKVEKIKEEIDRIEKENAGRL